jgi:hypothetical protein
MCNEKVRPQFNFGLTYIISGQSDHLLVLASGQVHGIRDGVAAFYIVPVVLLYYYVVLY